MPEIDKEGRIIGQPIIEIKANKEIVDTHYYLDNERFQIRWKRKTSDI